MARSDPPSDLMEPVRAGPVERAGEPPVVARLVVEIRSDGRRTIARGALEDAASGQGVAIEARGNSPVQLALSLARTMLSIPALGRGAARALFARPRARPQRPR
jgi:hypothetical protein